MKVAKGEASDEDRFQFGNKKKTKSAVEGNQPAASFMSHGNVFDDGALQSDTTLQSGATVDNARVQHPSNSQNSGFDSSEYLVSENSTQASVPRNDNQTADKAPVKSLTATEAISFNDACVLLQTSFESELARLVKEGTKAFEAHDFTLAEKLLKKTAKMKSMKDQIISTISVWQNSLAED